MPFSVCFQGQWSSEMRQHKRNWHLNEEYRDWLGGDDWEQINKSLICSTGLQNQIMTWCFSFYRNHQHSQNCSLLWQCKNLELLTIASFDFPPGQLTTDSSVNYRYNILVGLSCNNKCLGHLGMDAAKYQDAGADTSRKCVVFHLL